jgi:hypothetical protein
MRYLAACAMLLGVSAHGAEIDIRAAAGGRVSLKVNGAPLSEVLDRLARQTGMKVVYDGVPPRALVRGRQVENATPAEAVADVLEGLGVSYALRLDASGAKVDTLLVLGAARSAAAPPPRPAVPPVRIPGMGGVPVAAPDDADEDAPSEQAEDPAADQRSGRGEDRELRRPGPPGTLPTSPTIPSGLIGPLMLPTPGTAATPAPTPPPQ